MSCSKYWVIFFTEHTVVASKKAFFPLYIWLTQNKSLLCHKSISHHLLLAVPYYLLLVNWDMFMLSNNQTTWHQLTLHPISMREPCCRMTCRKGKEELVDQLLACIYIQDRSCYQGALPCSQQWTEKSPHLKYTRSHRRFVRLSF